MTRHPSAIDLQEYLVDAVNVLETLDRDPSDIGDGRWHWRTPFIDVTDEPYWLPPVWLTAMRRRNPYAFDSPEWCSYPTRDAARAAALAAWESLPAGDRDAIRVTFLGRQLAAL